MMVILTEDQVVEAAVRWGVARAWVPCYRTRRVDAGAMGGVDAILYRQEPWRFAFIDGKGDSASPTKRSAYFTSCLGALIKRIRFERGYLSNEAVASFLPVPSCSTAQLRVALREHGVHRNSEYVLALPLSLRRTVVECLDPALASLLHIRVLLISANVVEELRW
jgi:hypothetical protein